MRIALIALLCVVSVTCSAQTVMVIAPVETLKGNHGNCYDAAALVQAELRHLVPSIGDQYGIRLGARDNLPAVRRESQLRKAVDFDEETAPAEGKGVLGTVMLNVTVLRCNYTTVADYGTDRYGRTSSRVERLNGVAEVSLQAEVTDMVTKEVKPSGQAMGSDTAVIKDYTNDQRYYSNRTRLYSASDVRQRVVANAIEAALNELLNNLMPLIKATTSTREGWSYDPYTRALLGLPHCSHCGKEAPDAKARFCPLDGFPLISELPGPALVCPVCGRFAATEESILCLVDGARLIPVKGVRPGPPTRSAGIGQLPMPRGYTAPPAEAAPAHDQGSAGSGNGSIHPAPR